MNAAPSRFHRLRLAAVLVPGPLLMGVLGAMAWIHYKTAPAGMAVWLADAFQYKPIREFAVFYGFKILLPLYLVAGIGAWLLTLLPALGLDRAWAKDWKGREAVGFGLSGLLFAHLLLWWQVPTALWMLPGLRQLPFWLAFALLAAVSLAYPVGWLLRRTGVSPLRRGLMLPAWLLLWGAMAGFPQWVEPPKPAPRPGQGPVKVLMVGLDGLRSDVHLDHAGQLAGIPYREAITPLPATRLLWHVLWGGDPLFYSVGHVGPSPEEFQNPKALEVLQQAATQGWRPRFYIDDGGTIGLAQRVTPLNDALMPAEGWENFVNSNLASSFPLYAVWENWLKPFPTTNPWAPLDRGLKEALRLGRGSQWVMFHSCLAHQPIFLNRQELARSGRWWTLSPRRYLPLASRMQVTPEKLREADPRTSPFLSYRIRMASVLTAWKETWNGLSTDPDYKDAVRILFADHGERFHHAAPNLQLQGIHGFNLDPWELKVALQVAGPGFSDRVGEAPRKGTVSLLGIRDGIARLVEGKPFDAAFLESAHPIAPVRYHVVDRSHFTDEPDEYRQINEKEIAVNSYIGPHGLWFTEYDRPASERAMDVSVAWAEGDQLTVLKPLKRGGAHRYRYEGYQLLEVEEVDEAELKAGRAKVEALMGLPKP